RESVALLVGQARPDQLARGPVDRGLAIFHDMRMDGGLLDHVGIVELIHARHPAAGLTRAEITPQQLELLVGRPGPACRDLEVGMPAQQLALRRIGLEALGDDADRDTGLAIDAAGAIRDALASAETDSAEGVVEFGGVRPRTLG